MRPNPTPLIAILLLLSFSVHAQETSRYSIQLNSGSFIPAENITTEQINGFAEKSSTVSGKRFAVIQFEQIPGEQQKQQLRSQGIELLDYIPNNAYTVTITGSPDAAFLKQHKVRALVQLSAIQKMQPELAAGNFPARAVKVAGAADVCISFPRTFSFEEVRRELLNKNFEILSSDHKDYRIISVRVSVQRLGELASLPCVEYVQAVPGEDKPLSFLWANRGRDAMRVTLLNAPLSLGGKNLKGNGVVIGIGDDSDPQGHVDFTGRLITRAASGYFTNSHGTHVTGIAAGAGIRNEVRTGYAPKATVVSQVFSGIFVNAPAYVADHGMVITNNSYGDNLNECASFGVYDLYSRLLDQQALDMPSLQQIFAAGNSGHLNCAPYTDSFRTVLGGYQSAKNVLTVGNARPNNELIFFTSSKGPVRDGRIKPEITGVGSFITSAGPPPFDYYFENTGTSMAAPAIAGGMALLYEKYRQMNPIPPPGLNPRSGLIKALVCNSGEDWGRPGPDFVHGFGVANFWRAAEMLENNRFAVGNIAPLDPPQTISVNVPAGLAELKVMLYWNDPPAAAIATQTLINDLDLEVQPPSGPVVLPLILDTSYISIKNNAYNGVDNINNIEQVVIKTPVAGSYTIRTKATNITQNPSQEYFIVYDFVPLETKLTAPMGGEAYLQGENILIQWDSYGDPANTFTLEYSLNNGANWTLLRNNLTADKRHYFSNAPNEWFIAPVTATTDQALVRVTRNSTVLTSTSLPFVIHDTLFTSLSAVQCEGYMSIEWNAVTGATGYEVMMLQGTEMVTIATVSAATLTYTIGGLSKDSVYWATARPLIGTSNSPGRRGLAVFRKPDSGTCFGPLSFNDHDVKIDSVLSPLRSGRLFTSTVLGSSIPVTVRIKNLDDAVTSGDFTISYQLDAGPVVNETITATIIPGGGTHTHTFNVANNINLSVLGTHTLVVTITPQSVIDPYLQNNSETKILKQLNNPPITGIDYPAVYIDDFDAVGIQSYTTDQIGLTDLDAYDFVNSNDTGRIRTFVNTGIASSGNRAITLDGYIKNSGVTDSLTGTYNLDSYDPTTDDIRLDFKYKNHGQGNNAANKVWIRGEDVDTWIEAYDLYANQNPVDGTFRQTTSIELSDLLISAVKDFKKSFQIRWGQYGAHMVADNDGAAGYTFDDIRLYKVTDDMQMISIDTPVVNSCGLTANTPVRITVRNSRNTVVTTVPVRFRVNAGGWTTENISLIPANDTVQYTFMGTANLLAPGTYLIEAEVFYGTDSYDVNDTTSISITNTPVVMVTNSSVHLQDFEMDNGYWYTTGSSSWEYGTPSSYKINRAASGSKAWKTRLAGNYNDDQTSYLYSPCYDISTVTNPTLSFSLALDLEDCGGVFCDGAYVEFSTDGRTWTRLGANGQGTNWYNKAYSGNNLWSVQNYHRWHVATIPLTVIGLPPAQLTQVRFRFVMRSDLYSNREGIAIDDIHVYNNPYGIYDLTGASPTINQAAVNSPPGWYDFVDAGTNRIIASVNPGTQNMGSTNARSYVHTGAVRISSTQYYHHRNITVKPATRNLADSATVRFYFLDSETEALINATGCPTCFKPTTAYELGVTKYNDIDTSKENGTLADNTTGNYIFIPSAKTRIVPFDRGYYAEFKVREFSEFWLNNGGINGITPLPLKLLSFTATKRNSNDVLLEWATAEEFNVDRFEVEVAKGNTDYQQNRFINIGQLPSQGNSIPVQRYRLLDLEANKTGVWYYRLKMIEGDGRFIYSPVRPLSFTHDVPWQVYPNPSAGIFNLVLQENDGEELTVKVFDATGRVVRQLKQTATGFVQKMIIDLQAENFARGLYLVEVSAGNERQIFRVAKQ